MSGTKRKHTSSSLTDSKGGSGTTNDSRLELAKAMKALSTALDGSDKRLEALKALQAAMKEDFEIQIEQKKRQLEDLNEEYNHRQKTRHLQLEHEFKELGMAKVKEMLEAQKEMPILCGEYQELQAKIQNMPIAFEEEKRKICETLNRQHAKEIKDLETRKDLESQAKMAEYAAAKTSHTAQVRLLEGTIASLREELKAQRELTGQVAGVRTNELNQMQYAAAHPHPHAHAHTNNNSRS